MVFKKIMTAGNGVLGSQIAFQIAYHGFPVHVYEVSQAALEAAKEKLIRLKQAYIKDLNATEQEVEAAYQRLHFFTDLAQAVENIDLVIESVPENPEVKTEFYTKLGAVAPQKTVFATNSSTLLPSSFAAATGRPEKFVAFHFANEIWKYNTVEVMGHAGTAPEVIQEMIAFGKQIGMIPLVLHKEQPGYLLNSLLVPLLDAAMGLLVNGVADAESIDRAWVIGTGAPMGPCAIFDIVGLTTVYNIEKMKADKTKKSRDLKTLAYLKENFIDQGKLGVSTGQGFYSYPNPAYSDPDFFKSTV